jgi:UDP-glucose 4-epimerase
MLSQTRDYVYVGDVVRANLAALHYARSGVFNVGTGVETSVNELFHALRDEIDPTMPEVHEAGKPGEQRRSVLDNRLTEQELGWKPEMSLEDGLAATVDWFRRQIHARPA